MGKKSGTAGTPVLPTAPGKVEDADVADPGKVAELKAEQIEKNEGKYGTESVKPHQSAKKDDEKKSWIEFELLNEEENLYQGSSIK